jgi:hypothetical protein
MILGTGLMDIVAISFSKQEAPRDKKYNFVLCVYCLSIIDEMYNVSFELIVLRASCSISMEFLCLLWVSAGRGQNFPNNTRIY